MRKGNCKRRIPKSALSSEHCVAQRASFVNLVRTVLQCYCRQSWVSEPRFDRQLPGLMAPNGLFGASQ